MVLQFCSTNLKSLCLRSPCDVMETYPGSTSLFSNLLLEAAAALSMTKWVRKCMNKTCASLFLLLVCSLCSWRSRTFFLCRELPVPELTKCFERHHGFCQECVPRVQCQVQTSYFLFSVHRNNDTFDHPLDPSALLLQIRWLILLRLTSLRFMNVVFCVTGLWDACWENILFMLIGSLCVAPNWFGWPACQNN